MHLIALNNQTWVKDYDNLMDNRLLTKHRYRNFGFSGNNTRSPGSIQRNSNWKNYFKR